MFLRSAKLLLISANFLIVTIAFPKALYAISSALEQEIDIVTSETAAVTLVEHTVAFTLPEDSLSIISTDYIHIDLTNFTVVTAATSVTGDFTGTASFSVSGTTAKITGINVLPGDRITIRGITATNPYPASQTKMTISITVSEDEAGTLVSNTGFAVARLWTSNTTTTAEVDTPQGRLRVSGFTAPQTYVVFSEGENIIGTDVSAGVGTYSKLFAALSPNTHGISVYGIDTSDRNTSVVPMTVNTPPNQLTIVSDILLSPTLEISTNSTLQGGDIYATGSAYPGTAVTVFTDSPLRTYVASAAADGAWTTTVNNTSSYTPGDYRLYTLAQTTGGLQSLISPTIVFSVTTSAGGGGTACGDITEGDLNCDSIINLTDFSIMMYYWGTADDTADMNSDGIVNITDFSIMMYYWGT